MQQIIEKTFANAFDQEQFIYFIKNLLNKTEPKDNNYSGQYLWEDYRDHIQSYKRIAKYTDPNGQLLDVLIVKVRTLEKLERARTTLRNFVIKHLKTFSKQYALVAFYSDQDNGENWRFSFVKLEYKLEKDHEKNKNRITEEYNPAKRYSFLVGKNEQTYTAKKQLLPILQDIKNDPAIEDIENAFSIQRVTDEFFQQYENLYKKLSDYFDRNSELKKIFSTEIKIEKSHFIKKLLGQIVFLYFLQKKGWLGVDKDKKWGQGDRRFVQNLFKKAQEQKVNFFKDKLQYLFYQALATEEATDQNSYYQRFDSRIPFLNGGLFEADYHWETAKITIPEDLFRNQEKNKAGYIGTGILDVFDRYNFTIKEDEPLEKEVAIDPEMLGKVFENMLDIDQRKGKGAFYTPREIVHYMSQQSIINYLENSLNNYTPVYQDFASSQNKLFSDEQTKTGQQQIETQQINITITKQDLQNFILKGYSTLEHDKKVLDKNKTENKYELPKSIRNNADWIDKKLSQIKVLDPAIGSGAFPVGLLHELVTAMLVLKPHLSQNYNAQKIEKIGWKQNQDQDQYVYWLKRHIIQESIYGVDIDSSAVDIARLRLWLSLVVEHNNSEHINTLPNLDFKIYRGDSLIGYPDGVFKNVEIENQIHSLKNQYYNATETTEKKEIFKKVTEKLQESLNFGRELVSYKIDFDIQIYFSEVWKENKGFDIIIGNPPYISTKGVNQEYKNTLNKQYHFSDDSYNHFFFRGKQLLKPNGILSFITPKTFWTILTKNNLRNLLLGQRIDYIFDTANPFASAMVDTCITSFSKREPNNNHIITFLDGRKNFNEPEIYSVQQQTYIDTQNSVIFTPTEYNLKINKIYGKKVKELYDRWWNKISKSSDITKNKSELEKHRQSLQPGDITLLGCLTEGGQGLATANNGKYIAVRSSTKWATKIIKERPEKLFQVIKSKNIKTGNIENIESAKTYLNTLFETEIAELFDKLKEQHGRDIFGQGYIYKIVDDKDIADVDKLTQDEKQNGISPDKKFYVPYDKGDKDGNRWYLQTPFAIAWTKENVRFLKTNSGKKGQGMPVVRNAQFYFKEGFCWTNILNPQARLLKTKLKYKSVSDVGSMSLTSVIEEKIPNYFIVSLLNSDILFDYYRTFINATVNIQINDIRQLPIVIPNKQQLTACKIFFDKIIELKKQEFADEKTNNKKEIQALEQQINKIINELYQI